MGDIFNKCINRFLLFIWIRFLGGSGLKTLYKIKVRGKSRVFVCVDEPSDTHMIFISKAIECNRYWGVNNHVSRIYRVEVVMKGTNEPNKVFYVPELCSSIFKNTSIPHSCAIEVAWLMVTKSIDNKK